LFRGSCCALKPKSKLFTYGPFAGNYKDIPERKFEFDNNLKTYNVKWGLRDISEQIIPYTFMYGFTGA